MVVKGYSLVSLRKENIWSDLRHFTKPKVLLLSIPYPQMVPKMQTWTLGRKSCTLCALPPWKPPITPVWYLFVGQGQTTDGFMSSANCKTLWGKSVILSHVNETDLVCRCGSQQQSHCETLVRPCQNSDAGWISQFHFLIDDNNHAFNL